MVKEPLGAPPEEWVQLAVNNGRYAVYLRLWDELVRDSPPGVLKVTHRQLVQLYCRAAYVVEITPTPKPAQIAAVKDLLVQMGRTPSASARVAGDAPSKGDRAESRWEALA